MPGSAYRPKACVKVKLPIGVALRVSLGCVLNPSAPTCAVTAVPYFRQPPVATFDQACNVAVVLPVECAVTVMTRVALPVLKRSGNACPCGAAAVVVAAGRGLVEVRGAADTTARDAAGVLRGDVAGAAVVDGDAGALLVVVVDTIVDGDAAGAAECDVSGAGVLPAVRIGRNAGRAARLAAALERGAVVGTLSRAAAFMWSATTAQPATPSEAAPAAIIRPAFM